MICDPRSNPRTLALVRNRTDATQWVAHAEASNQEKNVNWDIAKGNWKQFRGQVKAQWGKLTDDQLEVIDGRRVELAGRIQEAYGISKDEAERQLAAFELTQKSV